MSLKGFTKVPNNLLNDERLSWGAKGLWAYMASKPKDWKFTIRGMASQTKDSTHATTSKLNELLKMGYATKTDTMTRYGRCCEYSILEKPIEENPRVENCNEDNPSLDNPREENVSYSNTHPSNTHLSKTLPSKTLPSKTLPSKSSLREETNVQTVAGYNVSTVDGKLRIVDEKGEVCGGNPYVERAYALWAEIMDCPIKRDRWNSMAARNLMVSKDKGEDWLRKTLMLCKKAKQDPKADFRAKNIANLADLQKNWEYVIDWARQKAGVRSKPNIVDLNECY